MSKFAWVLVVVIVAEVAVGGWLYRQRTAGPASPEADLAALDPMDAAALQAATRHGNGKDAWVAEADAWLAFGYFSEASACYWQAAELAPDDPEIRFQWAFCLSLLGRSEASIDQYRAALERGHGEPSSCHYFIGRNFLRLEQPAEAEQALQAAGGLPAAQWELARLYWLQDDLAAAEEALAGALDAHPRSPQTNWLQARILAGRGKVNEAAVFADLADLAKSSMQTPFDVQHDRMEELRRSYGLEREKDQLQHKIAEVDEERAAELLEAALERRWWSEAAVQLASLRLRQGESTRAEQLIEQVLRSDGPSPMALELLARAYSDSGRVEQARQQLERAAWMGPTGYLQQVHQGLSELYSRLGDEGLAQWHKGLAMFAEGFQAYWNDNLFMAKELFNKSVQTVPDYPPAWFYLGESYRRSGELEIAAQAYQNCLTLHPQHGRARDALLRLQRMDEQQGEP